MPIETIAEKSGYAGVAAFSGKAISLPGVKGVAT